MNKDFDTQDLRQNILRILNINSFSEINQARFADSAGVSRNHMLKVLSGDTNNPGIKTVVAIAKKLDCSIDELVGHKFSKSSSSNLLSKDLNLNVDLLKNSFDYVISYIQNNNISPTINSVVAALDNIYDYSFRRNLTHPDLKFAKWILSSTFED
jgi:transcriptional regulator with XRE-family HTH domain